MTERDDFEVFLGQWVSSLGTPIAIVTYREQDQPDRVRQQEYFAFFTDKPGEGISALRVNLHPGVDSMSDEPWKSWAKVSAEAALQGKVDEHVLSHETWEKNYPPRVVLEQAGPERLVRIQALAREHYHAADPLKWIRDRTQSSALRKYLESLEAVLSVETKDLLPTEARVV